LTICQYTQFEKVFSNFKKGEGHFSICLILSDNRS